MNFAISKMLSFGVFNIIYNSYISGLNKLKLFLFFFKIVIGV